MNRKEKTTITIIAIAITALAIFNIYTFTQPENNNQLQEKCYKDLCLYSHKDPVTHIKTLLNTTNKTHLVFEADQNATKANSMTIQAAVKMVMGTGKETNLTPNRTHAIAYENGEPVDCGEKTLEYCQNLEPGKGELLIHMKYPNKTQNNITIQGREITINTKSPAALLETTKIFLKTFT